MISSDSELRTSVLLSRPMSDQNLTSDKQDPDDVSRRLLEMFRETGALLEGHFQLTSGLHSSRYLQCALVLQHPPYAEKLCAELAAKAKADTRVGAFDLVIAPA